MYAIRGLETFISKYHVHANFDLQVRRMLMKHELWECDNGLVLIFGK